MKKTGVYILFFVLLLTTIILGKIFSADIQKDLVKEKRVFLYPVDKSFIEEGEIMKSINLEDSIWGHIKVKNIENNLMKNPYVAGAEVFKDLNGRLYAYIEQYHPVARVIGNKSYYIDDHGKKRPLSKHYTENVLLVFGNPGKEQTREIYELAALINEDPLLKEIITEIHLKNRRYLLKTKDLKAAVLFGDTLDKKEKFDKLKAIYLYLTKNKLNKKYQKINLIYNNQVVCN